MSIKRAYEVLERLKIAREMVEPIYARYDEHSDDGYAGICMEPHDDLLHELEECRKDVIKYLEDEHNIQI